MCPQNRLQVESLKGQCASFLLHGALGGGEGKDCISLSRLQGMQEVAYEAVLGGGRGDTPVETLGSAICFQLLVPMNHLHPHSLTTRMLHK